MKPCASRPLVAGLLAAGLLATTTAAAAPQGPVAGVARQSAPVAETDSGRGVTVTFRVTNPAATPRTILTHVVLPPGWRALFASETLDVAPASTAIEMITVAPPANAAAGDYPVRFEVRDAADAAPVTADVTVRVRAHRELILAWEDTPPFIAAGESFTAALLLTNAGNLPASWTLTLHRAAGGGLSASMSSGTLGAGESRRLSVEVRAPGRLTRMIDDSIGATVVAADTPQAEANFSFTTVPESEQATAPRDQLPVSVTIRAGSNRDPGLGSLVGTGWIDRGHTTTIDFGSVAGDQSHPLLRELDRRYASLTSPHVRIMLGDQTWSLSRLTEGSRYGYGGGLALDSAHLFGGAFVDTGRRETHEASQAAAFLGVRAGRFAALSVQYLTRFTGTIQSARAADLGSVKLALTPRGPVKGEFEVASGRSSDGTTGHAASGQLSFQTRPLSFNVRRVQATALYPVRDRTGLLNGADVSLRPLGKHLYLGAAFNGTEQLPEDLLRPGAPSRQRFSQASAGFGPWFRVQATRSEWTDLNADWAAGWTRESVTAELTIPLGPISLTPGAEQGRQASPLSPATPLTRLSLQVNLRLGNRSSLFVQGADQRTGPKGSALTVTRMLLVGGDVRPFSGTHLSFQATNNSNDAPWLEGTRWINVVLDQTLAWSHHVVATYRRIESSSAYLPSTEAWRVDYVVPLRIPLRGAANVGGIKVRVRNGDTGRALARARVSVAGRSLLTNGSGDAEFKDVPAGEYFVTVASPLIGQGRAVAPGSTIRAVAVSGRTVQVNATVVRTAGIEGSLRRFDLAPAEAMQSPNAAPTLVDAAGLAQVTIELTSNSGDVRVVTTDRDGRFRVGELLPGTWQARVVSSVDRPFYRLETQELKIEIAPGHTETLQFRLVPKSLTGGGFGGGGGGGGKSGGKGGGY